MSHFVGMSFHLYRFKAWLWLLCATSSLTTACGSTRPPRDQPNFTPAADDSPARVLFIVTSAGEQVLENGKRRRTGYFLSEFYEPHAALRRLGHEIYVATPEERLLPSTRRA